jgi:hypothetical protein
VPSIEILRLALRQTACPVEGCDLRPLIGVVDLGRVELVDRLVQRPKPELSRQRD